MKEIDIIEDFGKGINTDQLAEREESKDDESKCERDVNRTNE